MGKPDDLGDPGTVFWTRSLPPPDNNFAADEEELASDVRDSPVLSGRKRTSSLRDSMEREETVVQEADSTVNISEHLGQVGHLEEREEEMEGEQGAKRARDTAILPEMGMLKSLLEHTEPKPEMENVPEQVVMSPTVQEPVKLGNLRSG